MDTLEPSNKLIQSHVKLIENQFKDLKKENTISLKKQKIKSIRQEIEATKSELNMFEIDLCNATEKQRETYFVNFSNFENQIGAFEKELKSIEDLMLKRPDQEPPQLIDEATLRRNQEPELHQMERAQMVDKVDAQLEEADDDMNMILNDLMQGKNIMEEVTAEVKIQQDKLNKAREDIKDTYSLTKRSKKLISYFRRQIMTDKIICVFTVLIIIAIIIIIILKAMGFKSDSFNSNVLPNTNSSINVNSNTK